MTTTVDIPALIDTEFDQHQIRLLLVNGLPWWVGKDSCEAIGISQHKHALRQLDEDERGVMAVHTPGGSQQMICVNEAGLYSLMFISRSDKVKPFRRWVTHEVIPAVRSTGTYTRLPAVVADTLALPQTYADALRALADEVDRKELAEAKVAELEPKAEFYDELMSAHGTYSWQKAAFILGIGRTTLKSRLRAIGVLQTNGLPYARYMHHFKSIPRTRAHPWDGSKVAYSVIEVRPLGIPFLRKKLAELQMLRGGK